MKKLLIASAVAGLSFGLSAPTLAADNKYEAYQAAIFDHGDSGVSGKVIFVPKSDQMDVTVTAENADGMSVGIHEGVCRFVESTENAPPEFAFNHDPKFELADIADGESTGLMDLKLSELMGRPFSIAIKDDDKVAACGNIQ